LNILSTTETEKPSEEALVEFKGNFSWISLREEPVIYINSRPFVLRSLREPFANLEYPGIEANRIEEMEGRLKVRRAFNYFLSLVLLFFAEMGFGNRRTFWKKERSTT
jgi:hypothetical protein